MEQISINLRWWGDFRRDILARELSLDGCDFNLADGIALNLWQLDLWFKKFKPGEQLTLLWVRMVCNNEDILIKSNLIKVLQPEDETMAPESPVEILGFGSLYNG